MVEGCSVLKERVSAGLAAAKARGVQLGRPSTINGRAAEVSKFKATGLRLRAIARELKMPVSTVHMIFASKKTAR
jgi:DNA invertase Pin-like site-specific DNA recombinase